MVIMFLFHLSAFGIPTLGQVLSLGRTLHGVSELLWSFDVAVSTQKTLPLVTLWVWSTRWLWLWWWWWWCSSLWWWRPWWRWKSTWSCTGSYWAAMTLSIYQCGPPKKHWKEWEVAKTLKPIGTVNIFFRDSSRVFRKGGSHIFGTSSTTLQFPKWVWSIMFF